MTKPRKRFLHVSQLLALGTGIVLAWFRYGPRPEDPWALVPKHPAEPGMLAAHLIFVPALILAIGSAWSDHAFPKLQDLERKKRISGIAMLSTAIAMIWSGYAMQIAVDADARRVWAIAHWVSSGIWAAAFLFHATLPARIRRGFV